MQGAFEEDLTLCPRCEHSPMRITQVALTAQAIEQALVRHGLCARAPPAIARVEALGQLALAFGP